MQNLYDELQKVEVFTLDELEKFTNNTVYKKDNINNLIKDGLVKKINDNLFCIKSANRYKIGSKLTPDAYLCFHSALECHGLNNQQFYRLYVASGDIPQSFTFEDIDYTTLPSSFDSGVVTLDSGVRTTDIERTIIDCISDISKAGGIDEIVEALDSIARNSMDFDMVLKYLDLYNSKQLYSKAGYLFESFKDSLNVPDRFLWNAEKRKSERLCFMDQAVESNYRKGLDGHRVRRWNLVVPEFMTELLKAERWV